MARPIVQIYEIQTPREARAMIELGVDYVGSVIVSQAQRHDPVLKETVELVRQLGAVSSLIPLYTNTEAVIDTILYYRPHIVHFCDLLQDADDLSVDAAIALQVAVKAKCPDVRITRSIPIGQKADDKCQSILRLARRFEAVSDYFLTDTVLESTEAAADEEQPVTGFVGITGTACDWSVAAKLVEESRIPVILAGGVSPENVAQAVRQVMPFGVDSCTCTNAQDENGQPIRFQKDLSRVAALIENVSTATDE